MWLATSGGLGYAPLAPGTVGSAAGVALFWLLAPLGVSLYLVTSVGLAALGIRAADAAELHFERSDDGRIVIDEVVGQLVALLPVVGSWNGFGAEDFWPVVTGFVAFRVFDVWKPGPVRWAERRIRGGAGVMADDLVAGVFAAVAVAVVLAFSGTVGAA